MVGGGSGAAAVPKNLIVDDDRAQCAAARFTSIQAAVDSAGAVGDRVLVCAGTYTESVLINRSVSVVAQTPAAPAVECLSTSIDQDARMAVPS